MGKTYNFVFNSAQRFSGSTVTDLTYACNFDFLPKDKAYKGTINFKSAIVNVAGNTSMGNIGVVAIENWGAPLLSYNCGNITTNIQSSSYAVLQNTFATATTFKMECNANDNPEFYLMSAPSSNFLNVKIKEANNNDLFTGFANGYFMILGLEEVEK